MSPFYMYIRHSIDNAKTTTEENLKEMDLSKETTKKESGACIRSVPSILIPVVIRLMRQNVDCCRKLIFYTCVHVNI